MTDVDALEIATELAQLRQQKNEAHSRLDDLGIPRGIGEVVWTVRGRLDWLAERTVILPLTGPIGSLARRAFWNKDQPSYGTGAKGDSSPNT